jgi:hypothetical protein
MSDHTIMLFPMIVLNSHGGVFGGIRFLESAVLCLDGSIREDPHHGQSKEMTCHCGLMVLHVQEEWEVSGLSSTPL